MNKRLLAAPVILALFAGMGLPASSGASTSAFCEFANRGSTYAHIVYLGNNTWIIDGYICYGNPSDCCRV